MVEADGSLQMDGDVTYLFVVALGWTDLFPGDRLFIVYVRHNSQFKCSRGLFQRAAFIRSCRLDTGEIANPRRYLTVCPPGHVDNATKDRYVGAGSGLLEIAGERWVRQGSVSR